MKMTSPLVFTRSTTCAVEEKKKEASRPGPVDTKHNKKKQTELWQTKSWCEDESLHVEATQAEHKQVCPLLPSFQLYVSLEILS